MTPHQFVSALRDRRRLYGTLIVADSPRWLPVVANLGLDFVFIDTEHIALNRSALSWMCQAYCQVGLPPLVRIPEVDPCAATMALDGGAVGILAPYVESVEQVKRLAGATKQTPIKGHRSRAMLDGTECPEPALADYLRTLNETRALLVNVESVPAMKALDQILQVPELDGVIIGPHDLSCNLGIPEEYRHPVFRQAVQTIIDQSANAGKSVGIHMAYDDFDQEIVWGRRGANILLHSADIFSFARAMGQEITALRQAMGEHQSGADSSINI